MRTMIIAVAVGLFGAALSFGQTRVVYTLELGGNNHADLWEANQAPTFTPGVTSGVVTVGWGPSGYKPDLTWAVRVTVGGKQTGDPAAPGYDKYPFGAANLVFDLELYDSTGTLVATLGAAPLVASGAQNVPDPAVPGFWSSINDGDNAGTRGVPDILANAAFAISLWNTETEPTQKTSLIDPAPTGPNFDYGWYPTANGRSGVDIAGTKPVTAVTCPGGKLVGFGAGMKSYDYTNYRPGVGKRYPSYDTPADVYGFGAYLDDTATDGNEDPLNPLGVTERAVFEGQLSVRGLPNGTYTLKVVPSVDGTNVIQGHVEWNAAAPNFGGFGSFAVKAQEVVVANSAGMTFVISNCCPPPPIRRSIFYNQSFYDGNKVGIDAAPIATTTAPINIPHEDDADAIDTSKSPLLPGGGKATFANWTGYEKGINGLIYDIPYTTHTPVLSDFEFVNQGRLGTGTAVVTPTGFATRDLGGGVTRCTFTFTGLTNCWLKVTVKTSLGLASPDISYWGNAKGDCGDVTTAIQVNATDEINARNNTSGFYYVPVTNPYDYNKSGRVDATDSIFARNVPTGFNTVSLITR